MRKGILIVSGLLLAFSMAPAPAESLPNVTVSMVNFAFAPATVTVQLHGAETDMITWTNDSPSTHRPHTDPHNGVGEGSCFDSGNVPPGGSFSVKISAACALTKGLSVKYHCHVHPIMTGTINVVLV